MSLTYAVHAYAWTKSWSNATLDLIDRSAALGFDLIESPLMEIDLFDPTAHIEAPQPDIMPLMPLHAPENTPLTLPHNPANHAVIPPQ